MAIRLQGSKKKPVPLGINNKKDDNNEQNTNRRPGIKKPWI